jgi:hypothetical protein
MARSVRQDDGYWGKIMNMKTFLVSAFAAAVALAASCGAQAQIISADIGKNLEYQQTSGGVSPYNAGVNAFFFGREFSVTPSDFSGGDVSGNAFNIVGLLDCCGDFGMGYQTGYLTQADMDTAFPTGNVYDINAYAGTQPDQTVSILLDTLDPLNTDGYTADIPQLSGASFDALSLPEPGGGLPIDFNTFTPATNTSGQGFFTIFDYTTNTTVFNDAGFDPSTAGVFLPPGTLTVGDSYVFELIFDDYIPGTDPNGVATTARWDQRTLGFFSPEAPVVVPEPSTWAMALLGFCLLGAALRRRGAARAA